MARVIQTSDGADVYVHDMRCPECGWGYLVNRLTDETPDVACDNDGTRLVPR
jgi:hypothetical protein